MNEMLTIANFEISERHRQARNDRLVRERRAAGSHPSLDLAADPVDSVT